VKRATRRNLGLGLAASLACAVCCIGELGLVGGLSVLTLGVEFSELARLTPLLILAVASTTTVVVLRRRRRRARTQPPEAVPLPMPHVRQDTPPTPSYARPGSMTER